MAPVSGVFRSLSEVVAVGLTVEAGTSLVDTLELTVADDVGTGIVDLEGAQQGDEGLALGRRTGVGGTAMGVEASFVADANGMGIVVTGMGTDHLLRTALVELAIAGDVVVVAALLPAPGTVHLLEHRHRDVLVGARCRAVND